VSIEKQAQILFAANAVINWVLSVRGIVDPIGMTTAFGGPAPNYPFTIRLWSAFVFMFGCMFWETSRDIRGKAALMKYNWIEKTITASAVTLGYVRGEAPLKLMMLIVLTNWLWIPFILYYDVAIRRRIARP
jgi:hypothetical protein